MRTIRTPQSRCRFGIARRDVTPPVGIYHRMWGAAAHDRATGVHRPLTATAMVFQAVDAEVPVETPHDSPHPNPPPHEGGGKQVVVAVDHCLLWAREMEDLTTSVCSAAEIDRERLVVTFSHTHAAGLMGHERSELPGGDLIAPYLTQLAHEIAEAVREARRSVEPVAIAYGTGRCTLAGHRDFWDDESKQFVCGFNPDRQADDTVLVARVTNREQQTVATFVNYACHPTTLAWDNTLISPDFPGAMRELVEQATGAPCVFLQGASGDLGPREGFVGDTSVADRNGRQLGYAALAALEALAPADTRFEYAGPVVSGATIGTWRHRPLDESAERELHRWRCRRWTIPLAYRAELPSADMTRKNLETWQADERAARQNGDDAAAAEYRALAERARRALVRMQALPPGDTFPYPITLWRMGDAFWLAVEGEPYNLLARALRERFPDVALVTATMAGGSRCSYLPDEATYGKGIYQEQIAVLAPGCLERVIDAAAREIETWATDA